MKKLLLILGCLFSGYYSMANIHFINFEKIPNYENYFTQIGFIIDYVDYFRVHQGKLETPVNEGYFIEQLTLIFDEFKKLDTNNIETNFLLADIAFYLSELKVPAFKHWCKHYLDRSLRLGADSFRSYWFLGNYYNSFLNYADAYKCYNIAQKYMVEINESPIEFWQEYGNIMYACQAWAHVEYGFKIMDLLGFDYLYKESEQKNKLLQQLEYISNKSKINKKKMWAARKINNKIYFFSRCLGIQIIIDTQWSIAFNDYANNYTSLTIYPYNSNKNDSKGFISSFTISFKTFSNYHAIGSMEKSMLNKKSSKDKISYLLPDFLTIENKNIKNNHTIIDIYTELFAQYSSGLNVEIPIFPNEEVVSGNFFSPQTILKRFSPVIEYKISLESNTDNISNTLDFIKSFIEKKLVFEK